VEEVRTRLRKRRPIIKVFYLARKRTETYSPKKDYQNQNHSQGMNGSVRLKRDDGVFVHGDLHPPRRRVNSMAIKEEKSTRGLKKRVGFKED